MEVKRQNSAPFSCKNVWPYDWSYNNLQLYLFGLHPFLHLRPHSTLHRTFPVGLLMMSLWWGLILGQSPSWEMYLYYLLWSEDDVTCWCCLRQILGQSPSWEMYLYYLLWAEDDVTYLYYLLCISSAVLYYNFVALSSSKVYCLLSVDCVIDILELLPHCHIIYAVTCFGIFW